MTLYEIAIGRLREQIADSKPGTGNINLMFGRQGRGENYITLGHSKDKVDGGRTECLAGQAYFHGIGLRTYRVCSDGSIRMAGHGAKGVTEEMVQETLEARLAA